jgi:hypothetical protein
VGLRSTEPRVGLYEREDRGGRRLLLGSAGVTPDERVAEAIELVASKRDSDERCARETRYPGVMPVEPDVGEGRPSRWNTLRAMRALRGYERADS